MAFIHQDLWYGKLVPSSRQKVNLTTLSSAPSAEEILETEKDFKF